MNTAKIANTPELRAAEAAWKRADARLIAAHNSDASKRTVAAYEGQVTRAWNAMIRAMKRA